jgi:hypothetical protein
MHRIVFVPVLLLSIAILDVPSPNAPRTTTPAEVASAPAQAEPADRDRVLDAYAKLPAVFVANAGQLDPQIRYYAEGAGYGFAFRATGATLSFAKGGQRSAIELGFVGASSAAAVSAERKGSGQVSYFRGNDASEWRTGLPTYEEVVYDELWPGIDLAFAGADSELKYELHVAPGARVADVHISYGGAERVWLDSEGNLLMATPLGVLTDRRPLSYQDIDGARVLVESQFVQHSDGSYGFAVGEYAADLPLVIDPGLVYSTFLGGSAGENGLGIAVDAAGNAYVTGFTESSNFLTANPPPPASVDTSFNGGVSDVFVTKINATGTTLLYSTFLGGSSTEQGLAIDVDEDFNAYVTGFTGSSNFPIQSGLEGFTAYRPFYRGGSTDAFVTKLNPTGTGLVFSTYAGGFGADQGWGIAVHSSGDVYVTGDTTSPNLPVTPLALQTSLRGSMDAFFLRLDRFAAGAGYMSYFGGTSTDSARAIAIDSSRNVYLTGSTSSANFPAGASSFDTSANGGEDAFVMKLTYLGGSTPTGDNYAIGYFGYLGGSGLDRGHAIAIDAATNAYVTGITSSTNFPFTAGAFATTYGGGSFDAFVTKVNPFGTAPLVYSTYLGGSGDDRGQGIALDSAGDAHVAGRTASSNFPTTPGAFDTTWNLGDDAFVTKLNPAGTGPLLYSTYLGGSSGANGNNDRGLAIALDATGGYVTGFANSDNFPTTPLAYDPTHNGASDAFVAKLDFIGAPYTLTLMPPADTNTVGNSHTVTATVRDFAGQPVPGVIVRFTVTGPNPTTGTCTTGPGGQCDFTYTGTQAGLDTITAYADTNNNGVRDLTAVPPEPSGVATKLWEAGAPFRMTLEPAADDNFVGEEHCVTATVYDEFNNPVPGITVRFSVPTHVATFATPDSGTDVTDPNGEAEFCFTASLPGLDDIYAFADTNGNGTQDLLAIPPEPSATATKFWKPPASTAFCEVTITNGGWIIANNGDRATFGGNAHVSDDGSAVQGHEEYQDHGPADPMNLSSTEITATTCTTDTEPQSATIFGKATIDGSDVEYAFRIDVTDGGNGGSNDTYGIIVSNGYASGQHELGGGNVNIHKS